MMLRFFDILFSSLGLFLASPILFILYIVGLFDTGSPIFKQKRVGKDKKPFILFKFRTMRVGTTSVASHLADAGAITNFGHFLRRTKLDELPQLWNVLKGDMSLVGPRPGLFNQNDLINAREKEGIFSARPGITGLSQINGVDMSTPELLTKMDAKMLESMSVIEYFRIIFSTLVGRGRGDAVGK